MPTNEELLERRREAVPRGVANAFPVFPEHAENARLRDVEGREYVDFATGIAVLNVGHRHPRVEAAARDQLGRYWHPAFQVMPYEPYVRLAERLNDLAPGAFAKKSIMLSTGAEAVENAVKIARAATGRPGVITFTGGFHGRTLLTLAMTGKVAPYKLGFGPLPGQVFHAPFPAPHAGVTSDDALAGLDRIFAADLPPDQVAAIVIEPVQGEGGFNVAPFDFLRRLRERCDAHGILLIADEIQAGMARTGRWFAIEHSGAIPDLVTVAKSLGGGLPLSAVVGRAEVMDAPDPGGLGGTYGGNAVACAAALAVLDVIEEEGLLERAVHVGDRMERRLEALAERFPCVGDTRGLGAMRAMELVRDRESRAPWKELATATMHAALANRLVVLACGAHGNVLRLLPPLTATDEDLDEGLHALERALAAALEAA